MMPSSKHKVVQSAAVGLEAKKKEPNAGGRCSMEPGYQPLKGKSFYLDVRKQAAKLKKDLEDLGGTIETFLSKDINYVVSDRPEVQLESSKNKKAIAQSDASPAVSTPSPFHQSKDSVHRDSPSAPGGRVGVVTRGKAIVQKATTSQLYGTSNVLANARNWNVSIRYIDSVLKYINKEKQKRKESGIQSPQARNPQSREKTNAQAERKLSRPCLKVEDSSGHYRPTVKEMALWPRLTFDGHDSACPFDAREDNASIRGKKKTHGGARGLQRDGDAGDCLETTKEGNVPEETQPKTAPRIGKRGVKAHHVPGRQRDVTKDIKRGYCECCHVKYSDLDKHLTNEQHRNFVRENNHYVNLDTMIDEGPNIEQFLNDVMQHHEWQRIEGIRRMHIADDVTLISSPSNAPKQSECLQQASSPPQQQQQKQHLQEQQHHDHAEAQGTAPLKPTSTSTDTILDQTLRSTVSSKNDCRGTDAQDKECDSSCHDNLGTNVHSRNSNDHLSPSVRHPSRPTCETKMSLSTPYVGDSQTPPRNQQEESNSLQLHPTPGKSKNERRTPTNPPESCQNRPSKLSLSANRKRKRSLENIGSPAAKPLTQENPDNETLQQTPLQDSPNTAMKKQRRLRLSLTARKRLLKETTSKTVDQGDESKSCQDTSVCVDGSGATKDQNIQEPEIQKQSTSDNTKNSQETGTNKGGKDTRVITSKDQQQRASRQRDSLRRRSKRKRDSSDQHKTRSPKQRIIDSSSQAAGKVDSARSGDCLLENNRDTHGGSLPNTVSMDQVEEETENTCTHPSTQHPNLPSVFCSDPNKIEASFLGFSNDEITETELRLQQLSASPTMYANKLQEAALNVYCMPSSELQPDENDMPNGSSDTSDMEEAVVGMALRNLDNFPSDGSEWEAKVGGFMSVRLDTALQLKQRESTLTQARIQEKENLGENQHQQIVSSPSKSVLVETREQNASRPLEQSPRTERVLRTAIISNDPKSKPVLEGKSSTPRRVLSFESCNKTNPQKRKADQANHAPLSGSPSAQCPPENAPPNAGSTTSPFKSRKPVCSTPKRASRSPRTGKYNLVFSPDTPKEERAIIVEHYVHDVTEEEIDFPKISSPLQSNAIVSPIKNFTRSVSKRSRRSLGSPFKYKDSQTAKRLSHGGSPRRSLIPRRRHSTSSVPAKVFHFLLNPPGSPRKREESPSLPSSPLFKQSAPNVSHSRTSQSQPEPLHQISYIPINEHNKVSPIFFSNSKPHFSSRILHPDIKRRHSDRLRRPSNKSCVDIHTSPHRPTRSLSVSDGIYCSGEKTRDVYKFRDKTGLGKNTNFNQMGSPAKSGSNRKLQATASKTSTKLREHQTDLTEKEVVQEYGLPLSFFM